MLPGQHRLWWKVWNSLIVSICCCLCLASQLGTEHFRPRNPIALSSPHPSVSPATGYRAGEKQNLASISSEIYEGWGESCLGEVLCPSLSKDQTLTSIHSSFYSKDLNVSIPDRSLHDLSPKNIHSQWVQEKHTFIKRTRAVLPAFLTPWHTPPAGGRHIRHELAFAMSHPISSMQFQLPQGGTTLPLEAMTLTEDWKHLCLLTSLPVLNDRLDSGIVQINLRPWQLLSALCPIKLQPQQGFSACTEVLPEQITATKVYDASSGTCWIHRGVTSLPGQTPTGFRYRWHTECCVFVLFHHE